MQCRIALGSRVQLVELTSAIVTAAGDNQSV